MTLGSTGYSNRDDGTNNNHFKKASWFIGRMISVLDSVTLRSQQDRDPRQATSKFMFVVKSKRLDFEIFIWELPTVERQPKCKSRWDFWERKNRKKEKICPE